MIGPPIEMNNITINPSKKIKGTINLPGDKSISHRAVMIGSIANGQTKITNFLTSLDCLYTLKAFQSLGVKIESNDNAILIHGKGPNLSKPSSKEIYLGNSGTSMRLLCGILAAQAFQTVLTGDTSLSNRPMDRIIKPLKMMGADIKAEQNKYSPLIINGTKLNAIQYSSPVASAQVKSAIMLAGLYANGVTSVEEPAKSRDHTEKMFKYFGARVDEKGLKVSVKGPSELEAKDLEIPGDISSAAFFIVLATLLEGSTLTLTNVLHNPTRNGYLEILIKMGAKIKIKNVRQNGPEKICDIETRSSKLKAVQIIPTMIPKLIDELPILMVAACFAKGNTKISGASELRVKETDRINSLVSNLTKMGAKISVNGDDVTIFGTTLLNSAELSSFGDHRTAMSMVIAALLAKSGKSVIKNIDCIDTSFPGFLASLDKLRE